MSAKRTTKHQTYVSSLSSLLIKDTGPVWIYFNCSKSLGKDPTVNWPRLFFTVIWFLWRWRCYRAFGGHTRIPFDQLGYLVQQYKHISQALDEDETDDHEAPPRALAFISWTYPPQGWLKLNTDGAAKGNPGRASAGGILRDSRGQWICGFAQNIRICSSVTAELWGVYTGLRMAWDRGARHLLLEVDSLVVKQLLLEDMNWSIPSANLVHMCRMQLQQHWEVNVSHVYREANGVADALANKALAMPLGTHYFDSPPLGIASLMFQDISGVALPHLVPALL